jgi:aspartyl-tRNA(Asn)/glutamyl-tRNA(Gln) amidotransferase subunit A
MTKHGNLFTSALELRELIRTRQVSSAEVTADVLRRIDETQPVLNAFITVDRDNAMKAAQQADAAVARRDDLGALHGVPVSVKDIINTAGLRTTWGSRLMKDNVPEADAVAVQRLRKAGAIIVGKTTTSEFAHKLLTDAPLFGVTRNPWDIRLTPGGSSGGSAVAVAAGMGPLSLATDAGASTRLPAALTGIVGLKPTLGVVPHNQVPDGFNNFIHLGLMARTVADAALMLDVVSGEDRADPYSLGVAPPQAMSALQAAEKSIAGLRIAWRPLIGNRLLDHEVRRACESALDVFRDLGCSVDTLEDPVENAEPAWRILQQSNWGARFYAKLDEVAAASSSCRRPTSARSISAPCKAGSSHTISCSRRPPADLRSTSRRARSTRSLSMARTPETCARAGCRTSICST